MANEIRGTVSKVHSVGWKGTKIGQFDQLIGFDYQIIFWNKRFLDSSDLNFERISWLDSTRFPFIWYNQKVYQTISRQTIIKFFSAHFKNAVNATLNQVLERKKF